MNQNHLFNILIIEKKGVRADGTCDFKQFNERSLREVRIDDIQNVMKRELPVDADILLVAESEGAYIAPDIALADSRVTKLIDLSGGTKSWIDEEVSFVPDSEKPALREFFRDKVIGHPSHSLFYRGFSYAELNSYDNHKTYDSLKALKIPVLMLNGDRDRQTWVIGTADDILNLQRLGKQNISMHLFPGVSHSLDCVASDSRCEPSALRSSQDALVHQFLRSI